MKVSVFLTRKPGLSLEEFSQYWTNKHAPLLLAMPETKTYARRYVQLHNTGAAPAGIPTATCDGIAEVWVDDLAGALAIFTSAYYQAVIAVDEANFIDRSKTVLMFADENHILGD